MACNNKDCLNCKLSTCIYDNTRAYNSGNTQEKDAERARRYYKEHRETILAKGRAKYAQLTEAEKAKSVRKKESSIGNTERNTWQSRKHITMHTRKGY